MSTAVRVPETLAAWSRILSPSRLVLVLALSCAAPHDLLSQCPARIPLGDERLKYKQRGDRCEGRTKVDWTTLGDEVVIVSVTGQVEPFDPNFPADLLIYWRPRNRAVTLEAVAVVRGVDYRMDLPAPTTAPYRWPGDVISSLRLELSHLGVTGQTKFNATAGEKSVYVPIDMRLRERLGEDRCVAVTIKAISGATIGGAAMTLTPVDGSWLPDAGKTSFEVRLPNGVYASGTPLSFASDCLGKNTVYLVEVEPTSSAVPVLPARGYMFIP